MDDDPLNAARGCVAGVLLTALLVLGLMLLIALAGCVYGCSMHGTAPQAQECFH
jgi:hypothetical protein